MDNNDIIAYICPAPTDTRDVNAAALKAIQHELNDYWHTEYTTENPQNSHEASRTVPNQLSPARGERQATEEPLDYSVVDAVAIDLSKPSSGEEGMVFGRSLDADFIFPSEFRCISNIHFGITFNDKYQLIVQEMQSRLGLTVKYGQQKTKMAPSSGESVIIGGAGFLQRVKDDISILLPDEVAFQVHVKPFNPTSSVFRDKVRYFLQSDAEYNSAEYGSLSRIQSNTETRQGTSFTTTPGYNKRIKRRIGQGGFAVVYYFCDTSTGEEWAEKTPLNGTKKRLWDNELNLTPKLSHVSYTIYIAH